MAAELATDLFLALANSHFALTLASELAALILALVHVHLDSALALVADLGHGSCLTLPDLPEHAGSSGAGPGLSH